MTPPENKFNHLINQGATLIGVWFSTMPRHLENSHSTLVTQKFLKAFLDRENVSRTDGWCFMFRKGWAVVFFCAFERNAALRATQSILADAGFLPRVSIGWFDFEEHTWRTFVPHGGPGGTPFEVIYGPALESGFSDQLIRDVAAIERREQEGGDQA